MVFPTWKSPSNTPEGVIELSNSLWNPTSASKWGRPRLQRKGRGQEISLLFPPAFSPVVGSFFQAKKSASSLLLPKNRLCLCFFVVPFTSFCCFLLLFLVSLLYYISFFYIFFLPFSLSPKNRLDFCFSSLFSIIFLPWFWWSLRCNLARTGG